MSIRTSLTALLVLAAPFFSAAQVVPVPATATIRTAKAEVTALAVAPKGDNLLVGHDKGAELYDLASGKRVHAFPYSEDGSTAVYYVAFNENGEYVVLIGHSGKRVVFDVKTGKQETVLNKHRWVPDPRAVKAMGLDMSNSTFDRFYQQSEVRTGDHAVRSVKNGAVEFTDADGKAVQRIEAPENKDQHHLAPLLVWGGSLYVGQDDGRVLVYGLP